MTERRSNGGDTMLGAGHTIVGMARQNADTKFAFEGERPW